MPTPYELTPSTENLPTQVRIPAPRRRSVIRAAAWAAPAVTLASAAPSFAASAGSIESLTVSDEETSLLSLRLLDGGGGLVTAQALVTVPTEITATTAAGGPVTDATIQVTVGRPAGINLPIGRARGFGVAAFNGVDTTAGSRTVTYATALGSQVGFPTTTWTGTITSLPAGTATALPLEFGLAGTNSGISVSLLASFPVTVAVTANGVTETATTQVRVPVGAGIL